MNQNGQKTIYKPGYYNKKRLNTTDWIDMYIKKWINEHADKKKETEAPYINPCICFSRQIGVGALEIADILSEIIHYRVVDREILDYMARDTNITKKMIEFYDERYPGKASELFSFLLNKKTFIKSDYARQLVKTVNTLADMEPTIFVGRGTHLILPSNKILSIRLICSKGYRINRLAEMLNISKAEAETQLNIMDIEQHDFFKTVYQKKETSFDEFDLVINRDHINDAFQAAKIVACAFEQKFGLKI